MTRKRVLEQLADYFIEIGEILDKREYAKRDDTPIRAAVVTRTIGSWSRLDKLISYNFPEKYEKIGEIQVEEEPKERPKPNFAAIKEKDNAE
jgi:hypothetical protein